jgi:hypothetical protein
MTGSFANVRRARATFIVGAVAFVAFGCGSGTNASVPPTQLTVAVPSISIETAPVSTDTPIAIPTIAPTPTSAPTSTAPTWGADSRGVPFPPPDASGVNQAAVTAAPAVGPFKINYKGGAAAWPDACDLTNAAQLQALNPQITGVTGTPVGRKAHLIGGPGGLTPHNADCQWNVTTTSNNDPSSVLSHVDVSFFELDSGAPGTYQRALAEKKTSSAQYPTQFASYQNLPGGASCFFDGDALECLKGNVDFWVAGLSFTNGITDHVHWINDTLLPLAEKIGYEIQ